MKKYTGVVQIMFRSLGVYDTCVFFLHVSVTRIIDERDTSIESVRENMGESYNFLQKE